MSRQYFHFISACRIGKMQTIQQYTYEKYQTPSCLRLAGRVFSVSIDIKRVLWPMSAIYCLSLIGFYIMRVVANKTFRQSTWWLLGLKYEMIKRRHLCYEINFKRLLTRKIVECCRFHKNV